MIKIIDKYMNRILNLFCNHENKIDEMNAIVLYNSNLKYFDFQQVLFKEISDYASRKNIKIDKVVFLSMFDSESHPDVNEIKDFRVVANSDSRFVISQEKDKVVAKVFLGDFLEIRD